MKIKKFTYGITALIMPFFLFSCSERDYLTNDKVKILFSVDEFEPVNTSRTTINPSDGYTITWASGDIIGIFPREGYQEPFTIPVEQVGKSKASFDGGYWALKDGLTYNAYYPFDKANFESAEMKTHIPITYLGQEQIGNTCCAGAFDYTYSDWMKSTGSKVSFKFHHIGAIVVFHLEYPATTTYTQMTLSADEAVIPTTGKYDLTASNVAFIADEKSKSKSISLSLKNHIGTAGESGTFYMMLPPMELSNNVLTITLTSSTGSTCIYSIEPKDIKKAMLYEFTGEPTETNVEGSIDEWGKEETISNNQILYKTTDSGKLFFDPYRVEFGYYKEEYKENGEGLLIDTSGDITMLADNLFANLNRIESLLLPNTIKEIGNYTFQNCNNLTTINVPSNLESIGAYAFSGCRSLSSAIVLPNTVTSIGTGAFSGCWNLSSINLPNNIQRISDEVFNGCSFTSITLPENLVYIGKRAFQSVTKLSSIIIPNKVTIIDAVAFESCGLTSVTLPNSLTKIGSSAFACSKLNEIICNAINPPSIEAGTFSYVKKEECKLYVPSESVEIYKNTEHWKEFINILPLNNLKDDSWHDDGPSEDVTNPDHGTSEF